MKNTLRFIKNSQKIYRARFILLSKSICQKISQRNTKLLKNQIQVKLSDVYFMALNIVVISLKVSLILKTCANMKDAGKLFDLSKFTRHLSLNFLSIFCICM